MRAEMLLPFVLVMHYVHAAWKHIAVAEEKECPQATVIDLPFAM